MRISEVTVVVPTKNEATNIPLFLDSIPPAIPLVVVDASDDPTPELIQRQRPDAVILRDRGGIASARQLGAEAARTEWLLFTDADVTFDGDYFRRLRSIDLPPGTGGVVGAKSSLGAYRRYHDWFRRGQWLSHRLGVPAATGSNMLISGEALRAAGGFRLHLTCNEDSEIMWRVKRSGHGVQLVQELIVYERDHRRLERGALKKTLHSLIRCALLYSGCLPERLQRRDWGYWKQGRQKA